MDVFGNPRPEYRHFNVFQNAKTGGKRIILDLLRGSFPVVYANICTDIAGKREKMLNFAR